MTIIKNNFLKIISLTYISFLIIISNASGQDNSFTGFNISCQSEQANYEFGVYVNMYSEYIEFNQDVIYDGINNTITTNNVADNALGIMSGITSLKGAIGAEETLDFLSNTFPIVNEGFNQVGANPFSPVSQHIIEYVVGAGSAIATGGIKGGAQFAAEESLYLIKDSITLFSLWNLNKDARTYNAVQTIAYYYFHSCRDFSEVVSRFGYSGNYPNTEAEFFEWILENMEETQGNIDIDKAVNLLVQISNDVNESASLIIDRLESKTNPVITGVTPPTLIASSTPQKITIRGVGFSPTSNLSFNDGITTYEREPTYINSNTLDYDINVGNEAAEWTVQVINEGVLSNEATFNVNSEVDNTPPGPPQDFNVLPSTWSNKNSFQAFWQNPDDDSGISRVWYKLGYAPSSSEDGISLDVQRHNPFSFSLPNNDTPRKIHIWLQDAAGNKSHEQRVSMNVLFDDEPPSISITDPTSKDSYEVEASTINLGGEFTDAISGPDIVLWIRWDGKSGIANINENNWVANSVPISNGENQFYIYGLDKAGNYDSESIIITNNGSTTSYNLSITSENGSVDIEPDAQNFDAGTEVTLTANPNNGYIFDQWEGDASGDDNPITVTMDSDKSITATFVEEEEDGPDLVVEDYDVDPSSGIPGDEIDISFVIANRGNDNVSTYADGNYWSVDYYLSNDQTVSEDDIDLGNESYNALQQLEPGWTDNVHESEEIPNIEAGQYYILIVADGGNDVEESDEDNLKHLSFTVESIQGGDGPDLVIEDPSVNPTEVAPGDEVEISYILANRGNRDVNDYIDVSVARWEIAHYLSEDGNLDIDEDIRLGDEKQHGPASSFLMPRREPDWTDDISEDEQIPTDTEPGEYNILIVADEESEVQESNEGNNIESVPLIIANPIPSVPTSLTFYPNGNSVDLSWNANSEGDLASYNLYRGLEPGSLSLLQNINQPQTYYSDSDLESGKTYYYAISAVDNDGNESSLSAWVSYIHDQLTITDDWQLVSNPAKESKNLNGVTTYGFDGAYHSDNSLTSGKGYWVRSSSEETINFRDEGLDEMEIQVQEGWNLIGSLVSTLSNNAITDTENVIGSPPIYGYSIQNGYESVTELQPKQGYWLFADNDGSITLSLDNEATSSPAKSIEVEKPNVDILTFSNRFGEQELFYFPNTVRTDTRNRYLLPPVAPESALDVRTEDGYKALDASNNSIELTTNDYPVLIGLTSKEEGQFAYRIFADSHNETKEFTLTSGSPVRLQEEFDRIRVKQLLEEDVVMENALEPNYPNPFNNSTTIRYQLAQTSQVNLDVYDLAGRKVKTLIDTRQSSGEYARRFNTSGMASGIYFIRLQVNGKFYEQKMSLIK